MLGGVDLRWNLGRGCHAAFSTAADGDQRDPVLRAAWLERIGVTQPLAHPHQVHGVEIREAAPGLCPKGDALAVAGPGLAALVYGADCPGLVLVGERAFIVAHCGWRGVAGDLPRRALRHLRERDSGPLVALVGPGISGSCYEVDEPVLSARPWPAEALMPSRPGHAFLDLRRTIASDLAGLGLTDIHLSPLCTAGDSRLHSFRHQGPGLVQALVVWREV